MIIDDTRFINRLFIFIFINIIIFHIIVLINWFCLVFYNYKDLHKQFR